MTTLLLQKTRIHQARRKNKLIAKRQQAYLEAMDIPVWVARESLQVTANEAATQLESTTQPEAQAARPAADPVIQPAVQATAQPTGQAAAQPLAEPALPPDQPAEALIQPTTAAETPAQPSSQALCQGLKLGPGSGGVLLVCAKDSDSASKLGNDITRVLPNNPVWGWPDKVDTGVSPQEAVNENLFTCVAVFGDALAQLLFDKQVPSALGSATVVVLPAMSELEHNAEARRKLWSVLCRSGMIVA